MVHNVALCSVRRHDGHRPAKVPRAPDSRRRQRVLPHAPICTRPLASRCFLLQRRGPRGRPARLGRGTRVRGRTVQGARDTVRAAGRWNRHRRWRGSRWAGPPPIVVSLSRMNRILEIDPHQRIAWIEPGVANAALSTAAAPYGLRYGTYVRGTPGRIRTCDRWIRSPMLCPLSYGGSISLCRARVALSKPREIVYLISGAHIGFSYADRPLPPALFHRGG